MPMKREIPISESLSQFFFCLKIDSFCLLRDDTLQSTRFKAPGIERTSHIQGKMQNGEHRAYFLKPC